MEQTPESVWEACLAIIRETVGKQSYKTWFEPLKPVALDRDGEYHRLTVQLPSRFYYEWLEEHFTSLLGKTIARVLGPKGRLYYNVVIERDDVDRGFSGASMQLPAHHATGSAPPTQEVDGDAEVQTRRSSFGAHPQQNGPMAHPFALPGIIKPRIESGLNTSYTFDRFIEGDCNRLARSASVAIAQQPGATSFNPFLIYGGVGLGKTHLIQAIGNHALSSGLARTVLYISSERFTNDFVQSIQHNRVSEFSAFYRQIDLLIVDDIQFFGGKEKTQEEFFHIFNALHQSGKQIVLSSDHPPREIEGIEERLLSRFQWGLTADVQMPELETRIAILQRKAEDEGIELAQDIIEFIAQHVKSNIRELEGALIRLIAYGTLHRKDVDLQLAREVLRDLIKDTRVNLTIGDIQRIVCEYFGIEENLIRAKTRKREIAQARQVAMFFCKEMTQHSLKTIGLQFGGRDHSTVIHANQSVQDQIETDPKFRDMIDEIRHKIEMRSR